MASSSSSSSSNMKRYHVFPSFHGPDVRRTFLSHLHNRFSSYGITVFKDQEMERGHTIGHELVQAIRESRVSVVLLSKNYATSSWCLDELVEILKCKESPGHFVLTVFYDIDPSHVRKQSGGFGEAFERTCERKTEEVKQRWKKALTDVAEIAGEHSINWNDEGEMIEKIVISVSSRLNVTRSKDFEGMVGMEAHLRKLDSLLCLECDEVKMIGIWGPAGIGKTTIARALYNQLSSDFRLKCFMGNLKGSFRSTMGVDDYDSNLSLQNQLLSKILNQRDMRVHDIGAIKEWLQDQRVLIILDDVDDLEQLEVLAKEPSWFGSGSRIIVTSEDKRILKAHEINDIYPVGFLSKEEALAIFCLSAFKKTSPSDGFEELAKKVAKLCGNLPLGLRLVGSSLRGQTKIEWELQLYTLETCLDIKIEDVLRVGYDKLLKKHQALFLHIACFFNNEDVDHVTSMLAESNLDVKNGLNILVDKSLVHISTDGKIVMHYLLQKLGRQEVVKQSNEPGKRQFLVEAQDVVNVLANGTGTESVIGISFDMSKTGDLVISRRAFERMRNLQFLRVRDPDANVSLCTLDGVEFLPRLEDMEFLPRLRLLNWESYPGTSLPVPFRSEFLVELHMPSSKLEKLWEGIQPLVHLKKCTSLVKFPSSILNLYKLKTLRMWGCKKLQVVPTNTNSTSLEKFDTNHSSRLRSFPDISRNIKNLSIVGPLSVWSHPKRYEEVIGRQLKKVTHVPSSVRKLDLSSSDIETIPEYVRGLLRLQTLIIENCTKIISVEGLPSSLKSLHADNCVSLERVKFPFPIEDPIRELMFSNCLRLNEIARRVIMNRRLAKYVCLPGKQVPAEFTHKATSNSITISPGTFSDASSSRFKACLLLSPIKDNALLHVTCYLRSKEGILINQMNYLSLTSDQPPQIRTEHLFIFRGDLLHQQTKHLEVDMNTTEIVFEFTCSDNHKIVECGVRIFKKEYEKRAKKECWLEDDQCNIRYQTDKAEAVEVSQVENVESTKQTGGFLSGLRKLGLGMKKKTKALL
ncbi:hypothetical protein AALP_AA6G316100 [Arabis alpina]|uniref:ADP-ribosyl cyclase/cyclic ADP-ribose hydrolase n=1 Tax=Arabis alpina TaxID=50452 RepID=A0A087GSZ4_ARAAL|nr:hypothetical protein AALP_AA6G316100 [Arabis alpina]